MVQKNRNYFGTLAKELVFAIRGGRSQNTINRSLGAKHNKVSKWETGQDSIYWSDFVTLCELCKIKLAKALFDHTGFNGSVAKDKALFKHLSYAMEPKVLFKQLETSRATLSRWTAGQSPIPLRAILVLLGLNGQLHNVLSQICDVTALPSMEQLSKVMVNARKLFAEFPEAAAFLCFTETVSYGRLVSHRSGLFAQRFGTTEEREKKIISALRSHGLLAFNGKKYSVTTTFTNIAPTAAENFAMTQTVRLFWMRKGLEIMARERFGEPVGRCGHEVFSMSDDTYEKVEREVIAFRSRLHRILEEAPVNTTTHNVCLLQMQLTRLLR